MSARVLDEYTKAMIAGNNDRCATIEQMYGLYGYPPEVVSVGLKAVDDGLDPDLAVGAYLNGGGTQ